MWIDLFDLFFSAAQWLSVEDIVKETGLDRHYVREWVYAMTSAEILEFDRQGDVLTFYMSEDWISALSSQGSMGWNQLLGVFSGLVDDYVRCFQDGGGVNYSKFEALHVDQAISLVRDSDLTGNLIEQYWTKLPEDVYNDILNGESFRILDIGCGRGKSVFLLASEHPHCSVFGYDISKTAINYAVGNNKCSNATFAVKNVESLNPEEGTFDIITMFDVLHDLPDPDKALKSIVNCLSANGVFLIQEIEADSVVERNFCEGNALSYSMSMMYCMTLSLSSGGHGHGMMWGMENIELLLAQHFSQVNRQGNIITCKK